MEEIRLLQAEDIDVRVAQTTATKEGARVNLLLYKNARIDMKILDELFSPLGWKREHKLIGNNLYCVVSVRSPETHEWISKEDVGVESNTEAEKGQASDAFKRACVNWGIGRELYTAPRIVLDLENHEFTKDQNNKVKVWTSFRVSEIEYNIAKRAISYLTICDKTGVIRYTYGTPAFKQVSEEMFERIIRFAADGTLTKSGKDMRTYWIEITHATDRETPIFDMALEDYLTEREKAKKASQKASKKSSNTTTQNL